MREEVLRRKSEQGRTIDEAERLAYHLMRSIEHMSGELDHLHAAVAVMTDAVASAQRLLNLLAGEVRKAAGVQPDNSAALADLANSIDTNAQALAQAVAANTPGDVQTPPQQVPLNPNDVPPPPATQDMPTPTPQTVENPTTPAATEPTPPASDEAAKSPATDPTSTPTA